MVLERPEIELLTLRMVCLFMVGNLANALAEAQRVQSVKHQRTAQSLTEANRQLLVAQEAVRRSDKLAALGQLTAGLAHELRNPLGTIKASAEMLNQQLSAENEVAREVAGFISSEVDRTNSLVTRFLQFARPLKLRLEPDDLAQLLDKAIARGRTRSPRHCRLPQLRARDSALPHRLRIDGARLLQPRAQRRAGHRVRRNRHREDARPRAAPHRSP